jgi:hypothetical protein
MPSVFHGQTIEAPSRAEALRILSIHFDPHTTVVVENGAATDSAEDREYTGVNLSYRYSRLNSEIVYCPVATIVETRVPCRDSKRTHRGTVGLE